MPSLSTLDDRRGGKCLLGLLALLLALAIPSPTLLSQESDHISGPDKAHDPTGAWLLKGDAEGSPFILTVFHKGGTLTGDDVVENYTSFRYQNLTFLCKLHALKR
jgi:hypothetical protein